MVAKSVNLTFDLEEFDIPIEFGVPVSEQQQQQVTLTGTYGLLKILEKTGVKATFFTTANFALNNPGLVQEIAQVHEIASHAYFHHPHYQFKEEDLPKSRQVLAELTGKAVTGFRMPRLQHFDIGCLRTHGYEYDSSLHPTCLPGRYNHFSENPLPHIRQGIAELPCSVSPYVRFPLFWLSFKNLPEFIYQRLARWTLRHRGTLVLYFHPWEFADLSGFQLPFYIRRHSGIPLLERLERLIEFFKRDPHIRFTTCSQTAKNAYENNHLIKTLDQ